MKQIKILIAACLFFISPAFGQNLKLKVAVAANLQSIIKVLQSDFKRKTGITASAFTGFFFCGRKADEPLIRDIGRNKNKTQPHSNRRSKPGSLPG